MCYSSSCDRVYFWETESSAVWGYCVRFLNVEQLITIIRDPLSQLISTIWERPTWVFQLSTLHTHTYVQTPTYAQTHTHMRTHTNTLTYTHTHTHRHTYTYTNTDMHTHHHSQRPLLSNRWQRVLWAYVDLNCGTQFHKVATHFGFYTGTEGCNSCHFGAAQRSGVQPSDQQLFNVV